MLPSTRGTRLFSVHTWNGEHLLCAPPMLWKRPSFLGSIRGWASLRDVGGSAVWNVADVATRVHRELHVSQ